MRLEKGKGLEGNLQEMLWDKIKESCLMLPWLVWTWYYRPGLPKLFHIISHFLKSILNVGLQVACSPR